MGVIAWLVLGAFSGWIANRLMNSRTGLIDNIITGIIGSFIGGFVFNFFEKNVYIVQCLFDSVCQSVNRNLQLCNDTV